MAQKVKRLSTMQETRVQALGWEDPLEKGMASHSSILAWRIPMDRGTWQAIVHGDTGLIPWSGNLWGGHGNPLQYSCLENPMDRGACRTIVHAVANSQI